MFLVFQDEAADRAAVVQVLPTANNERPLPLSTRSPAAVSNALREVNETEPRPTSSSHRGSDASTVSCIQHIP